MSQSTCRLLRVILFAFTLPIAVARAVQPGANPSAAAAGPDIRSATYASPRNGQSFDVTNQLESSCRANSGSCVLSCGNQLAGDPDFGTPKYCRIVYACPGGQAREVRMQEGERLTLSCPMDASMGTVRRDGARSAVSEAATAPSFSPGNGTAPGFDCSRASNGVEQRICVEPELRRVDGDLALAYAQALVRSGIQREALIDGERRWISERNNECGAASLPSWVGDQCLSQAYKTRLAELEAWAAPGDPARGFTGAPRMGDGDEVYCDEIISSAGIVLTSGRGWGIPLSTPCRFQPPVDITIVASADPTNLRIRYAAEQVIFNWEGDRTQLRIDGGPANGLNESGEGGIPAGQYVTIRWLVTPSSQDIYVNGQLRFHHSGDYSHIDRPVSVFTAEGSTVLVKSIVVHKMH